MFLPWNLMFLVILTLGSTLAMSASSWFSAWIGLEMNMLALLAIFFIKKSPRNSEAALKYFLIQTLASSLLIFSAFLNSLNVSMFYDMSTLLTLSLLIKLGASPFHVWLPQVAEGLSWLNCFIILTWQKLAPFILLLSCLFNTSKTLIFLMILGSSFTGAILGLSHTSFRKIIAFSSINHLGWMLSAFTLKILTWAWYYVLYSILLMMLLFTLHFLSYTSISSGNSLNSSQSMMVASLLLSFGGLPPFLGFLPKWLVINELAINESNFTLLMLLGFSLITLFFYLRMSISSFMLASKFLFKTLFSSKLQFLLTFLNASGLLLYSLIFIQS